jgi:hypothetical protein
MKKYVQQRTVKRKGPTMNKKIKKNHWKEGK